MLHVQQYYSSSTTAEAVRSAYSILPTDPPTEPPTVYSSAAARKTTEVVAAMFFFYDLPRGRVLSTLPACRVRRWDAQPYYSSSSTAEAAPTAPEPTTHHVCTAVQQDVRQQYVSAFMRRLCCCIVLRFPCFFPAISGTGDDSFRRSPLVEVGVGARSFAHKTLCRVGRAWRSRAAAGGRMALWTAVPKRGILKQT